MKALILNKNNKLQLLEKQVPSLRSPTDAIIRIKYTGICGTDRSVLVGKFSANAGVIMGHETVGTISEVGDGAHVQVGDRVLLNPTLYCGWCSQCRVGKQNFCENKAGTEVGLDLDGSYAEYMSIDSRYLHVLPNDMTFEQAVLIEPLACALNNIERIKINYDDNVLIIGGGPIGALCALASSTTGASVTLVEGSGTRRKIVSEFLSKSSLGSVEIVADISDLNHYYDAVVDTVGKCVKTALPRLAPMGRLVIMGYNTNATSAIKNIEVVMNAWTITGAGDFTPSIFERAFRLAARLPMASLISHVFPLEDFEDAFSLLDMDANNSGYGGMKVLLRS